MSNANTFLYRGARISLFAGLFSTAIATAAPLAVDIGTGGAVSPCTICGTINGDTFGYGFTVTGSIRIDSLGFWDENSDGLGGNSSQVGLWTDGGALLAMVTIDDSNTAIVSSSANGQWLAESITPLVLSPGDYSIGALFFDGGLEARFLTSIITIPEITNLSGARAGPDSSFQTAVSTTSVPPLFGPTFTAVAVPTSSTLFLMILGIAGLFQRRV